MTHDYSIELVSLALDAALLRQTAIAQNVANINTRGYQTVGVSFEDQLNPQSIESVKPQLALDPTHKTLDQQIALGVQNATHYRALVKGLNHRFALMALAVHGNQS